MELNNTVPKKPEVPVKGYIKTCRACSANDIFISGGGYQCGNCGAWAWHSWDLKHRK